MTQRIKIDSMNVRGLSNRAKRLDIFNWLNNKIFSIYCLQDIPVGQNMSQALNKTGVMIWCCHHFPQNPEGWQYCLSQDWMIRLKMLSVMKSEIY